MNSNDNVFKQIDMERERIAKDIHDSSLQNIVYMIHKLEIANIYLEKGDKESVAIQLHEINDGLKDIVDDIRSVIFDLKPMSFEDIGFSSSIEQYIAKVNKNTDILFDCKIDDVHLDSDKVIGLYRVIQECIINVIKHSKANKCYINIYENNNIVNVIIKDDGIGFDVNKEINGNHFGLQFAYDRVASIDGSIDIKSDSNIGTECIIQINK